MLSAGGFTLDPATWAQLTAWADYDPCDDLTQLKTPTLAIFGENDPLVPVRASVERYQRTAARAARHQQTLVFPGAGHRLQVTAGFAPGYLTQLSTWCQDQREAANYTPEQLPIEMGTMVWGVLQRPTSSLVATVRRWSAAWYEPGNGRSPSSPRAILAGADGGLRRRRDRRGRGARRNATARHDVRSGHGTGR